MASAVTLIDSTPTTHLDVKGVVIEGVIIEPRVIQEKINKFWGVIGESLINGERGGRNIMVPVWIYDDAEESPAFDTARKLADYIDYTLNTTALQKNGTLTVVSESNHSPFLDTTFKGAALSPEHGIKKDFAGTLGGGYFAECMLLFRQLSDGEAEEEEEP